VPLRYAMYLGVGGGHDIYVAIETGSHN
jgi:hypothetical protein